MTLRASFLMAGSVRVARPWAPTAHDAAVVLAAVKDAARRRRRWPEDGPSLTATARAGWGCAGRDGRMVRGRTEGCGETSHFRFPRGPWRTREAEAPHASRRAHQFQKWASCRLPQFESCFVLRCPRPSFYARKFNPTDAKTFIAAADTKKAMVKIGDANRS